MTGTIHVHVCQKKCCAKVALSNIMTGTCTTRQLVGRILCKTEINYLLLLCLRLRCKHFSSCFSRLHIVYFRCCSYTCAHSVFPMRLLSLSRSVWPACTTPRKALLARLLLYYSCPPMLHPSFPCRPNARLRLRDSIHCNSISALVCIPGTYAGVTVLQNVLITGPQQRN